MIRSHTEFNEKVAAFMEHGTVLCLNCGEALPAGDDEARQAHYAQCEEAHRNGAKTAQNAISDDSSALPDAEWETLVSAGIQAREAVDGGKWIIGNLAMKVGKSYGKDTLGEYAVAINMEKKRVQEYRTVADFYQKSAGADFYPSPALSYTHYRDAMRMKDEALSILEEAESNLWTVEQLRLEILERLGKPTPPVKIYDGMAECYQDGTVMVLMPLVPYGLVEGKKYRIVIYEVES